MIIKKNLFECHVFVCTNKKDGGRECCADKGSAAIHEELKAWAKEKYGKKIRINKSGCLDFCSQGVAAVIYPKTEWHLQLKQGDINELKSAIDAYMASITE